MTEKIRNILWAGAAAGTLLLAVSASAYIFPGKEEVHAGEGSEEKISLRMMYYWGDTDSDISSRYLKEIL